MDLDNDDITLNSSTSVTPKKAEAKPEEPCLKIPDLNMMMSNVLDEMEDCLLSREENITDPESISGCRAGLEKSFKVLITQKKPDQGESQECQGCRQHLFFGSDKSPRSQDIRL